MKRIRVDTSMILDTRAPEAFQQRVRRLANVLMAEIRGASIATPKGCASCGAFDNETQTHPDSCRVANAFLVFGLAYEVEAP